MTEGDRPRVLMVGDATAPTGFARVIEAIGRRLHERYELHQLALNYRGDPHELPWRLYPAGLGGDAYGVRRLGPLLDELEPDLLFMVQDPWILMRHAEQLRGRSRRPRTVAYIPVEGSPLPPEVARSLADFDAWVAYTNFGAGVLAAAAEGAGVSPPALQVIPHGVDTALFRPVADARARLLPKLPNRDEAFIVLNANRNQARKRIDLSIEGFAAFARDKPASVRLYLHMGVEDEGWNVALLAARHGIGDRLILTHGALGMPAESDDKLNLIYNACDVGLNTACLEGWGLVSFEHAATGAAQVVPRHGACAELWAEAGVLVDPSVRLTAPRSLYESQLVSPAAVAAALERLYADADHRRERAEAARALACRREYSWDAVAERWAASFDALLADA